MSKLNGSMGDDFDLKYRPQTLDDLVGQPEVVAAIKGWQHVPRAVLFYGHTGCGKTTSARIVVNTLLEVAAIDYKEVNCGTIEKPIQWVRDLTDGVTAAPLRRHRAYTLDEVQTFSRTKGAQEGLLKVLEECPPRTHFFLCTTDPERLLKAIRGRCEPIAVKPIAPMALKPLLQRVAKAEAIDPPPDERLLDKICDAANGSARDALKRLQKIAGIADPAIRLASVEGFAEETIAFELVKVLMPFKGGPDWPGVCTVLGKLSNESPETIRQIVLKSARTALLKPGNSQAEAAYKVIRCLDTYLEGNAGHAALAANCYRICFAK